VARKVGSGLAFEVYDTNLSHIAPRFRSQGLFKRSGFLLSVVVSAPSIYINYIQLVMSSHFPPNA
jgi:hypothetical protein